jgi:hypothetical protein
MKSDGTLRMAGVPFTFWGTRCEDVPKSKATQRTAKAAEAEGAGPAAKRRGSRKRPAGAQEFGASAEAVRAMIAASWPEIVEGLIDKARGGNYQHAKLLLEFFALVRTDDVTDREEKEQLCDALLRNLTWGSETLHPAKQSEPAKDTHEETETR